MLLLRSEAQRPGRRNSCYVLTSYSIHASSPQCVFSGRPAYFVCAWLRFVVVMGWSDAEAAEVDPPSPEAGIAAGAAGRWGDVEAAEALGEVAVIKSSRPRSGKTAVTSTPSTSRMTAPT